MGYERIKTEHAGAKNGGGAWMTRAAAKQSARRKRRQANETPWTGLDPQPGDFDVELDHAHSAQIEICEGNPDAKLSILVSAEGDDTSVSSEPARHGRRKSE